MPTVLITGGHAGIGLACAKQLASVSRYNLVLAGRSPERMEPVAQQLRTSYGVQVTTLKLDTSSLVSVRKAAAEFGALLESGKVDAFQALLLNAGGRHDGPITYSPEGFETTFATNCLGHFLLMELLVDRLKQDGRVVFTVSGTHDPETTDGKMVGVAAEPDAAALARQGENGSKSLSAGKRYTTSKLCMMLYAYELDRRLRRAGSAIESIAFDPGSIPETGLMRTVPKPVQWLAKTWLMKALLKRLGVTQSTVDFSGGALARIAADPAYANVSGKYLQANHGTLSERRSSKMSYDEQRAAKLWNDSRTLVKLKPNEEPAQLR